MARRIHTPRLHAGRVPLDPAQAHHARAVLRLNDGDEVEVFDDAGNVARGVLVLGAAHEVFVRVDRLDAAAGGGGGGGAFRLTVAAAVPKGDRADWMVEKLSELGVAAFVPLVTARGVVLPEGRNKRERWVRLATESAKQSRRRGVMRVDELTPLARAVEQATRGTPGDGPAGGWFFSTGGQVVPAAEAVKRLPADALTVFVGPEGGWTADEEAAMAATGLTPVGLTPTILRVETAAVAGAALVAAWAASGRENEGGGGGDAT